MTSASNFTYYAPRLQTRNDVAFKKQKRVSAKVIQINSSEDVLDQTDNISLDDYAREERFAQARRMPTDD